MAEFLHKELEAIKSNPLKEALKVFRTAFESKYLDNKDVNVTQAIDQLKSESLDGEAKQMILNLILVLQVQPAAQVILSRKNSEPLLKDLLHLTLQIISDASNIQHTTEFINLVLTEAKDVEIWAAVLDLVARIGPTPHPITPPTSHPPSSSCQETPWSFNTGNFENTSECRRLIDEPLKKELEPTLRIDVPNFVAVIFEQVQQLDKLTERIFGRCTDKAAQLYNEEHKIWLTWPSSAKEELVLDWLQELMNNLAVWIQKDSELEVVPRQVYRGADVYLDGIPFKRKMDVGIIMDDRQTRTDKTSTDLDAGNRKTDCSQILVTGELKSNPAEDGKEPALLDLARYVREVFRAQDRRFVLGFTLCGSKMRLWLFDRSGACGSTSFDINQNGHDFIRVMLGFYLMTDEQLGLDPTIQGPKEKRYIEINRDGQVERLILSEMIIKNAAIVSRATTCWKAFSETNKTKKPLIVKDSWQYIDRPEEGVLIKEATDEHVRNIAKYYHHETVQVGRKDDSTHENIRRRLTEVGGRTSFRKKALEKPNVTALGSEGTSIADEINPPTALPKGSSSSAQLRSRGKAVTGQIQSPALLRVRSSSSAQLGSPGTLAAFKRPTLASKRSSSSAQLGQQSAAKRSRLSLQSPPPEEPSRNLLHLKEPHQNRVHRRVITRDAGKSIYEAKSLKGIVNGILGAIQGHESLLSVGILHRDISIGNIMLNEEEDGGFLIDLDLAVRLSDYGASGAPSKTGTKIFMAIGALRGEKHSFMHDLESFFWVLFWICMHHHGFGKKGKNKRRTVSPYERWNYEPIDELAKTKIGEIERPVFLDTMKKNVTEYCEPLKPCLTEMHSAVFGDGKRWTTGNPERPELYSDLKKLLGKATSSLRC